MLQTEVKAMQVSRMKSREVADMKAHLEVDVYDSCTPLFDTRIELVQTAGGVEAGWLAGHEMRGTLLRGCV